MDTEMDTMDSTNNEDKQLSKTLSWLLRHGAIKERLKISPEGYIPVQDILQHKLCRGKYTLCDIQRVVSTNDKQRFKLRNTPDTNVLEIKAHQGHTISKIDDSGLTPILEAKYKTVVHGTYNKCWPCIKTQGLSCMQRKHIHLAKGTLDDPTVISGIRKDVQIYVFIDLAKALADGINFYESENGVVLTAGNDKGYLESKYFSKVIQVDTGYPTYTQPQDLVRVFASYGPVVVDKINNRFAVLNFGTADDANEAIDDSNKVNIYGEFLDVRPFTGRELSASKQNSAKMKKKEVIVEPRLISLAGDFHSQLDSVLRAVRLSQEEVARLSALYADLERVLQLQWPGCVALPFGSITTGLGIKGSDADCFVQVPPVFRHPATNFVNKAKRLLQSYPWAFAEVLAIPRANTPIVKFFYVPAAVYCDLTFKTPLGARNSKLIACLLHADPRLVPVAVVLKYWAKVHGFSGTGKLTNYALTMLIIFYLQQKEVILPSIEWLQRDRSDDVIIDYWNTGFKYDYELLPKTKNTSPISELLGGFFKYYSSFDFDKYVVCPLTGYPVAKELFTDLNKLPPVFERYKRNVLEHSILPLRFTTSICVQDPIEQSHNVASPINSRLAHQVKAYFKFAADAYEKEKANGCAGFLKILLLQKPKLERKESKLEYRVVLYPQILQCIDSADWKAVVQETMMQTFEMCKIPLTKVELKPSEGVRNQTERYTGTIVKAIWKRKQFTKLYSCSDLSFIDKQTRITEEILKADKASFKVNFQLTLSFSPNHRNVAASVKLIDGEWTLFIEFGKFFISSLRGWFVTLIKPYCPNNQENTPVANGSSREGDSQAADNTEDKPGVQVEVVTRKDSDTSSETLADTTSDTIDTNDNNTKDPKDMATETKNTKDIATDTKNTIDIANGTKYNEINDTNDNNTKQTNDNKTSTP